MSMHQLWPRIAVVMEGGLISAVVSDDPRLQGLRVLVIDHDTDGADSDDPFLVVMDPDTEHEAYVMQQTVGEAEIDLKALYAARCERDKETSEAHEVG